MSRSVSVTLLLLLPLALPLFPLATHFLSLLSSLFILPPSSPFLLPHSSTKVLVAEQRSREGMEWGMVSDVLLLSEMDRKDCSAQSTSVNVLGWVNDTGDAWTVDSDNCLGRSGLHELTWTPLSSLQVHFGEIQGQLLGVFWNSWCDDFRSWFILRKNSQFHNFYWGIVWELYRYCSPY